LRIALLIASAAVAVTVSAPAAAQIKAGIPPKPKSVIAAEKLAKAEAAQKQEQKRQADFARLDANRDGVVSADEYKAAGAIQEAFEEHLDGRSRTR
jgi:hypothetical protein